MAARVLGTSRPRRTEESRITASANAVHRRLPPAVFRFLGLHAPAIPAREAIRRRAHLAPLWYAASALHRLLPGDTLAAPVSDHAPGADQAATSDAALGVSAFLDAVPAGLGLG